MSLVLRTFALDLRSVALLRAGLALLILADLVDRAGFMREHYTDFGIYPRAALALDQTRVAWSLHMATGSTAGETVLFLVAAGFAVALFLGWHTRVVAVASWIMLVSLQNRNPAVGYGADAFLRALLLFALFLPLEARWSVDAKTRGPDALWSVPAVGVTVQIFAVYFFTGLLKLPDASWRNLSAVYFALHAEHHATYFGLFVGRHYDVTRALTLLTLVIELAVPFLLLVPIGRERVRLFLIAVFVTFHLGHAATMHLGYFPWVSILAWLTLLPSTFWERLGFATNPGVHVDRRALPAGLSAVIAMVILLSNVASAVPWVHLPPLADRFARATSMQQRWIMFIHPMHNGWFVAPAQLASGDEIDVLNHGAPVSWDRPAHGADRFPNMRWRKLITDLMWDRPSSKHNRALFARNICYAWNEGITDSDRRMISVDLVFMEEDARTDGTFTPVQRKILEHHDCYAPRPEVEDDSARFFAVKPPAPSTSPDDATPDDDAAADDAAHSKPPPRLDDATHAVDGAANAKPPPRLDDATNAVDGAAHSKPPPRVNP